MSTANTRLIRLLDRGFYPVELPPPFHTRNFSRARIALQPPSNYSGSTLFYDGGTFRGQLRKFGIINPINYLLLSRCLADHWPDIVKVYRLSGLTGSRPKFPAVSSPRRAIDVASIHEKRKSQQHLASSYPVILALDINQFYGSIYTHSIPWAVLGKPEAKRLFRINRLRRQWSNTLDKLVRNCNQQQTIGLPIGPDTSRILSELILSRIDTELVAKGTGIRSDQVFHNIDDYQIGVADLAAAEEAQSRFVRIISQYELRLNDFKTSVDHGIEFRPSNFQRNFDILNGASLDNFVEHFFEILYSQALLHPGANVLGYALRRFSFKLTSNPKETLAREYLQRLAFATPHQARWILPLLLNMHKRTGVNAEMKRLLVWGIKTCGRRNDIGNLLWFLYSAIFLRVKLSAAICQLCFELSNGLVDLMLFHGRDLGLFRPPVSKLRERYRDDDFESTSWLPLYEIERRNWDSTISFAKIGGQKDMNSLYEELLKAGVEFYQTDDKYFSNDAFEDWNFGPIETVAESGPNSVLNRWLEIEQSLDGTNEFHSGILW